MPRGTLLSENEKGQIDALSKLSLQPAKAVQLLFENGIKWSGNVVQNYLSSPATYGTKITGGPKRKMTKKNERRLMRAASNSPLSTRALRAQLVLSISVSHTRAYLNKSSHLPHMRVKCAPPLTERHKTARIRWARQHVRWQPKDWGLVLFSDEKRFNVEGLDGVNNYWHEFRKSEELLSKRQNGGGIMLWEGTTLKGRVGQFKF